MEQVKGLLILYGLILLSNVLFSALLWRQYADSYYKVLCFGWITYSVAFLVNGAASSGDYLVKALGFSFLFFPSTLFAKLMTSIIRIPFTWKPFAWIAVFAAFLSWYLDRRGVDVNVMAFPIVFAASLPGLYYSIVPLLFHRPKLTMASFGFALATLVANAHGVDYAFAFDKPEFIVPGFTLSIIMVFAMATFSTAAVLERLTVENTRIRVEMEHKAMMTNAAKLASLGEMAGGVAHEINTPLAAIQVQAEQLQEISEDREVDRGAVDELAAGIVSTVGRIVKIIQGLRAFSRDAAGDPFTVVSVDRIVADTLIFCQERFHKRGVKLILPSHSRAKVSCRPVQISQALLNLLNNAFDAVSSSAGDRWIRLEVKEESERVRLVVSDSGSGVPPELREKIFQPFFTTREVGKGTGLGLSISKGIVEGHRGTLTLEPTSANTSFVITLPMAA